MSDETRMHNLLGKFFDKNAGANKKDAGQPEKEPEKAAIPENNPESVPSAAQTEDDEPSISDELFADILADLLADDGEEAAKEAPAETIAAEAVEEVTETVETVESEAAEEVTEAVEAVEAEAVAEATEAMETVEAEAVEEVTEAVETVEAEAAVTVAEAVAAVTETVEAEAAVTVAEAVAAVTEAVEAAQADTEPAEAAEEAAQTEEPVGTEAVTEAVEAAAAEAEEIEEVSVTAEAAAEITEAVEAADESADSAIEEAAAELEKAFGLDTDTSSAEEIAAESAAEETSEETAEDTMRDNASAADNGEENPFAALFEKSDEKGNPDISAETATAEEETVLPEAEDNASAEAEATEENAAEAPEKAVVPEAADDAAPDGAAEDVPALDPEDAMLMSALGYGEGEIQQSVSARRDPRTINAGKHYSDLDNAFAYDGCEYRSKEQNGKILSGYADEQKLMYVRIAGTAFFAILLFIYDLFGKKFGGPLSASQFPVVNILISLQLLLLTAVFSFRSIGQGLKGIFNARPVNDSVTAGVVIFTVLYDIILAIAAPSEFTLYNFPAAFCLCLTVAADELTLLRETRTFRRLSSFDTVCTLEKIATPDDAGKASSTYRLRRGTFASNYFRRVNKCSFPPVFIYVILFGTALAFVLFFISLASSRSEEGNAFVNALNVFITVIQFALPSFAIVSYVIPFFFMMSKKIDDNAVILHESDTQDYDKVGTIVLDEQDIFNEGSIKINGIMNCNPGSDYFDTLAATSAIFDKVGGTISYAFRTVAGESMSDVRAEKIKVCDGGVEADVNGVHYVIGTSEYLGKKWISCPDADNRKYLSAVRGGFVLYIAADGVTSLRLNMQYSLDSMSAGLIGSLSEKKIRVILRCQDPFIKSEMVTGLVGLTDFRVIVLRTDGPDEDDGAFSSNPDETVDGGLIADGVEWISAIIAAESCGLYRKWNKLGFYISSGLIILGALLACFLGGFGTVVGMPSFYIVLFQILSVIPTAVMSRLVFD